MPSGSFNASGAYLGKAKKRKASRDEPNPEPAADGAGVSGSSTNRGNESGDAGYGGPPEFWFSGDFRSCRWYGRYFRFTYTQSKVVKLLFEAWQRGAPELAESTILNRVNSGAVRLYDLFRGHPAWGSLIITAGRGLYQLNLPDPYTGKLPRPDLIDPFLGRGPT